jgi:predicted DNA-binding transcriptional regulator AlpA
VLIAGALDAYEPGIDALCLQLLELLVTRGKLSKEEPSFIEKRRKAISDATINYRIMEILEGIGRCGQSIHIPASLVVLIREQLCGSNPDLHQLYLARERFRNAASSAGQHFQQTNKQISIRKLAAMAGVSRGTAERWLADKHFQRLFDFGRRFAASNHHFLQSKKVENAAHKERAGREQVSHQKPRE